MPILLMLGMSTLSKILKNLFTGEKKMPSKKALMSGVIAAAVFMLVYNKVPAIRRALGGA